MRRRAILSSTWWSIVLLGMLWLLPLSTQAGKTIRVQGMNANYKISEKKGEWRLKGPGMDGFALRNDGDGKWAILDPASAVRLKGKKDASGSLVLEDVNGALKFKITFAENQYTVFTGGGDILVRVVITDDENFDVFGRDGKKTMVGKLKKRGVTVKETKSSTTLFKIKGCDTVLEASLFAIPIQFTGNVLIWQVLTGS